MESVRRNPCYLKGITNRAEPVVPPLTMRPDRSKEITIMKSYTIDYADKSGPLGVFTRSLPELSDLAKDVLAAAMSADDEAECLTAIEKVLRSYYWGWFRQVLVTLRAAAKRFRQGNKTTAPLSTADTAARMQTYKLLEYDEPTEGLSAEDKAAKAIAALSPAQLIAMLAKAGITVTTANG